MAGRGSQVTFRLMVFVHLHHSPGGTYHHIATVAWWWMTLHSSIQFRGFLTSLGRLAVPGNRADPGRSTSFTIFKLVRPGPRAILCTQIHDSARDLAETFPVSDAATSIEKQPSCHSWESMSAAGGYRRSRTNEATF